MFADRTPENDPAAFLGGELKRARLAAGLTQEQVARIIGYDRTVVTKAESGAAPPTSGVLSALIEALKLREVLDLDEVMGWLATLVRHACGQPVWSHDWVAIEERATVIRWWEPLLVPGLLQTEEYARTVLGWGASAEDDLDSSVAARLDRQRILDRPHPPEMWMLLREPVLYQRVGSAAIMRGQLDHLCDIARRPHVTIQVVPDDAAAYGGFSGAFATASAEPSDIAMYLETGVCGMTIREPGLVERGQFVFEHLRAEAIPKSKMLDLLTRAGERWDE